MYYAKFVIYSWENEDAHSSKGVAEGAPISDYDTYVIVGTRSAQLHSSTILASPVGHPMPP